MVERIRRHLTTIVVAMLTAAATVGGPSIAANLVPNADKVDGKHAVGSEATVSARAGKLVATDPSGYLPNNILKRAPNSDKLDGLDSTAFTRSETGIQINQQTPLAKNASETWSVHSWDPADTVIWTAVPTTVGGTMNTVQSVELMENGKYRYWITVWNYGSGPSTYKLRRLVISQPSSPTSATRTGASNHRLEGPFNGSTRTGA